MNWIKIILANFIVLFFFIVILEVGAGVSRIILGKDFRLPSAIFHIDFDIGSPHHPCIEMKTDTLLDHVPNHQGKCKPLNAIVEGEYVLYPPLSNDLPIILTLGGSTTSGFYQHTSAGETYPKALAKLVKDKFQVINGGVGAYSSLQEFYKLVRDSSRFNKLKIVISYNGSNELPNYHGPNTSRSQDYPFLTETQFLMNEKQIWIDQRINNMFNGLLPNTYSLLIYFSNKRSSESPVGDFVLEQDVTNSKSKSNFLQAVNAAERWETNVRRMQKLMELENAQYFVFLQPTLGLEGVQSSPPENTNDYKIFKKLNKQYIKDIRKLYTELKPRCEIITFCFDISDQVPPTGNMYNDPRHHNAKGNKILAKVIWDTLKKELKLVE
jgi:lysophospholipase L1-like esterase